MRWSLRILIGVIVMAGAIYGALLQFRPTAVVQPVTRGRVVDTAAGTVTVSAEIVPLQAEVEGRIVRSKLDLGAEVHVGDLLVEVDSSGLEIQIDRLKSDLAAAKRRLEIGSPREQDLAAAEEALRIAESDFAGGTIAKLARDAAVRGERSARQIAELERVRLEQDVATYETELKLSENRLQRMKIEAGVDGTIVQSNVEVSERISPGTVLAQIMSRERLVELRVSEEDVAKVSPGMNARVQFQPYPMERFDAVVEQILPPLDVNTQRFRVYLKVNAPVERLLHGMTGEAFVTVESREDALIIPRDALIDRSVFVVRNGRVALQSVETGFVSMHEVELKKGLNEGDLVVVEGIDELRDGDRVKVRVQH